MAETLHRTDHQLVTPIQDELAWTQSVNADHIGVAVNDGAITLSGEVATFPEKEAAVHATLRVRGVKAVVDNLVVHHANGLRDDNDIAREATAALQRSVLLAGTTVRATVKNHIVTLTGELPWEYERSAARYAVAYLPGVSGVVDNVSLIPPRPAAEASKTAAGIEAALVRNAELDASHVHVSAFGDRVTLSGTVSSWAERREAVGREQGAITRRAPSGAESTRETVRRAP